MQLLNIIDQMGLEEFAIFFSVFLGLVNFAALMLLRRKQKKNDQLNAIVELAMNKALTPESKVKFNVSQMGFVDGGVLIALAGVAIVGFIYGRETVPNKAIVNKEEIRIDNSVYQCKEIRRKVIKYYDIATGTYKTLPIKPNEGCEQ